MRKIKTVFGAFIILILILLVLLLRPVDYTPYFQTDYYQQTIRQLNELKIRLPAERDIQPGQLLAGFGKASITPGKNVPLAGYSARKGKFNQGVHDCLFVKAVALKSGNAEVVLVSLDALICSRAMADTVMIQISSQIGLQRHQILFGATHTHCGPGAWENSWLGEQFAGPYNEAVFHFLTRQISAAIVQAHRQLSSAQLRSGSISLPEYVKNRLVGKQGIIDPDLSYVLIEQANNRRIVLGSYSAHATTLSGENMQFSAGYPGYWQRRIEKQFGASALFFAGGAGSHGPRGKGREFEKAKYIGEALADSLISHLSTKTGRQDLSIAAFGLKVHLPETHVRVADNWRLAPWLADKIVFERDSYLQIIRIGQLLILGTPGDFSGEIAAQLKDYAYRRGYQAIVTSFNGSYIGYIIPSKYYHFKEYEPRTMSFFGPAIGDYIPDLMRRMIDLAMQLRE